MQGDRRTFLGEMPLRILESKLGIQRDPTLTYQNQYNRGRYSSGYYNDSSVRGGYDYNPNSGVPVKRGPDMPAYQLGTRSYHDDKRAKNYESGGYSYAPPRYDRPPQAYAYTGSRDNAYSAAPRYPPDRGYYPPPQPQYNYGGGLPRMDPNTIVNLRPPTTAQFSNFDNARPPNYIPVVNQRKRDDKYEDKQRDEKEEQQRRPQNRFSRLPDIE